MGMHLDSVRDLDFDVLKESATSNETLRFELFKPKSYDSFVERFYDLAIQHKPPFEEATDKGV